MFRKKSMLIYLIYIYVLLLPLLPSKINNIPVGDIILFLIIFVYIIKIFANSNSRCNFIEGIKDFFKDYLTIFMFILCGVMFLSAVYAPFRGMAIKEGLRFATYIILFFIIKYEISDKNILNNILKVYIISVFIVCIFGIIQYFTKINVAPEFMYPKGYAFSMRVPSTLENPNSLGAFLIIAIFPLIMVAMFTKEKIEKMFYWITSALAFVNIILSGSRNAWGGVLLGLLIIIIIYNWKALFFLLAGSVGSLIIPAVRNRISDFKLIFQDDRINLWKLAIKMIKDHPIKGVGNGNYYCLFGEYVKKYPELGYNHHENFTVHNSYLKIQSELGILGSLSFLGILISIVVKLVSFIKYSRDGFYKVFYKGFIASTIVFFLMNLVDNLFFVPKIITYFWILVAISQSIIYNNKKRF